jgi:hypothetical protein
MILIVLQFLATLALAFMGIEMANNPPKDDSHKCYWRTAFVVVGLILLVLTLIQGSNQSKKDADLKHFTEGGKYPSIRVELYYGPKDGMERTINFAGSAPPIAVWVDNPNDYPIYDLSVELLSASSVSGRLESTIKAFNNGSFTNVPMVPNDLKGTCVLLPGQFLGEKLDLEFYAQTRSGYTKHDFHFAVSENRWEHSNSVWDIKSGIKISNDVSTGFLKAKQ